MNLSPVAAELVAPRGRDVAEVRALVLERLGQMPSLSVRELEAAVFAANDLTTESLREAVPVDGQGRSATVQGDSHPAIRAQRLQFALGEVLHGLYAEGIISPSAGDLYGAASGSIPARGSSWSGSLQFEHHHTPAPAFSRWKLASGSSVRAELAREDLPSTFEELLGPRGSEVLREGIRAFHRGLAMEVSPDTEWGSVLTLLSSGAGQVLVSFDITPEVRQGRGDERLIGRARSLQ
ncbi:hypothetical protein V1260_15300 [Brachybacterium sp. J144]|uniref:hypothetical protein n=1 Tax=Brachybacterium sp. J144 TaxID=3116487 RepID=UPI002E7A7363|nr:hypothetical protein [Brachybacterium sp. J144]MEE1652147.1 hypothetical protein [Brachybacterium sp. J144]